MDATSADVLQFTLNSWYVVTESAHVCALASSKGLGPSCWVASADGPVKIVLNGWSWSSKSCSCGEARSCVIAQGEGEASSSTACRSGEPSWCVTNGNEGVARASRRSCPGAKALRRSCKGAKCTCRACTDTGDGDVASILP